MTLLNICQNVLAEVGWPVAPAIASNTDATAQQVFAIAKTELRSLSEVFSWPHLEVEYPFATVIDQSLYVFPLDFRVLAQQSLFDASEYYQLKGSVGIQDWHYRKYGLLGSLNRTAFRLSWPLGAASVEMTPAPVYVKDMVAIYASKEYARNEAGDSIPTFAQDTDTSKIPESYVELGIKWRFRRAKGLDYSAELAEYNATVQAQFSRYLSQAEIPVGGRRFLWDNSGLTPGYVPENGFGA